MNNAAMGMVANVEAAIAAPHIGWPRFRAVGPAVTEAGSTDQPEFP